MVSLDKTRQDNRPMEIHQLQFQLCDTYICILKHKMKNTKYHNVGAVPKSDR